jgi:hypothetical protein
VIVGGGFVGLAAAKALRKTDARVVLIDRQNHHVFQPLLYQVATSVLSPAQIASPIRGVLQSARCRAAKRPDAGNPGAPALARLLKPRDREMPSKEQRDKTMKAMWTPRYTTTTDEPVSGAAGRPPEDALAESIIYICALIADQPRTIDRYINYFGERRPAARKARRNDP